MKVGNASGTGRYHIQAEINMVPLIDVSLVLLIIFMVISPMLVQSQLTVNVPKVASSGGKADETALRVEISADGRMAFQGKAVSREELRQQMAFTLRDQNARAALYIAADKSVPFDAVVYVMDIAKQLKVQKLGVAVQPQT